MGGSRIPGVTTGGRHVADTPRVGIPGHGASAPGPDGLAAKRAADEADLVQARELALDLVQLALDIAGIIDPTPVSDGASALISLARGNWFDALLSGASMIPYVGDLAKAGKLPKYLRTLEKAVELAQKSAKAAEALLPGLQKLQKALDLIPSGANKYLDRMKESLQRVNFGRASAKVAGELPDISKQFKFRSFELNGHVYQEATGRLGVPGKVMTHRSPSAQRSVSKGTGDHAGHLIGDRFGAPGGKENLFPQNARSNSGGTFWDLENRWDAKLQQGWGVEVKVSDVFKKGDNRPFMRKAEWTEISPTGERTVHRLEFANTHTPNSRASRGIEPTVKTPQEDNVINADFVNKKRLE